MLKIYEELVSFAKVNKEFADEIDPGGRFWNSTSQQPEQDDENASRGVAIARRIAYLARATLARFKR